MILSESRTLDWIIQAGKDYNIHDLIISENYTYYSAVVNAAKAAYLATLLKLGINEITRYDPSIDLSELELSSAINPLIRKIKSFRPEAYFYWAKIGELL